MTEVEIKSCKPFGALVQLLAADVVIDTSECGPQEIAEKIVEFVRQGGWLRGHRRSGHR